GIVLAETFRARKEHLQRFWFDRHVLVLIVSEDVEEELGKASRIVAGDGEIADAGKQAVDLLGWRAVGRPHAGQIGAAIGGSRGASGEGWLPVLLPGNSRGRILEPLRVCCGDGCGAENGDHRMSKKHDFLSVIAGYPAGHGKR